MRMKIGCVRQIVRDFLQESAQNATTDVNGYRVLPTSDPTGSVIRLLADVIGREPGLPRSVIVNLLRSEIDALDLFWMLEPEEVLGHDAPTGHLWRREMRQSPLSDEKEWLYYLMPGAEVLRGTSQISVTTIPFGSVVVDHQRKRDQKSREVIEKGEEELEKLGWKTGDALWLNVERYLKENVPPPAEVEPGDVLEVIPGNYMTTVGEVQSMGTWALLTFDPPVRVNFKYVDPKTGKVTFGDVEEVSGYSLTDASDPQDGITRWITKIDSEPPDWRPEGSIPEDWYAG